MKISEIIPKDKIIPQLKGRSKEEVINELADLFKDDPRVYDFEALKNDIFKREKIMSTGIGNGIAIPHCTTNVVKEYIAAFGRSPVPVEFGAIDNQPVSIFFLIAGNDVKQHMKLLGSLTKFMKNEIKEQLLGAKNSDEIYHVFKEFEERFLNNPALNR
ncbi:MAG TPA: PTS sugar transporter subunit IIA [Ignavibacteriaceae bacterium]|nr:PTS sugar transporter subunit IIA [Ignavibacteriaceae bacterium]